MVNSLKNDVDLEVLVAAESGEGSVDLVDDVQVTRLPRLFKVGSAPLARFGRAIKGMDADICHMHFPDPAGEIGFLLSRSKKKLVITYHSDIVRQKFMLLLFAPIVRRILARADKVLVSSPQIIKSSPFLRAVAEKCVVIPFAIDVDRFKVPDPKRVTEITSEHKRPIILFVGRFIYYKGLSYLIDAMKQVDADLVLVGSGPLKSALEKQAARAGVDHKISFVSGVSDWDLVNYYHACHMLILPSVERSEAFGLVQLEAHASGKPVISTNLSTGVPHANLDGITGLTVPVRDVHALADAIDRLLKDSELRERLGRQARVRVQTEFGHAQMAEAILSVYKELDT